MPQTAHPPVVEFFVATSGQIREAAAPESAPKTPTRRFTAKVGDCLHPGRNGRLYPESLWKKVIAAKKQHLADGYVTGSVDHGDWGDNNLRDTPVIWRSFEINKEKEVIGTFDVLTEHSKGKDLTVQIDGGLAVGFSTTGYGHAHEADEAEAKKYGLKYGDAPVWVMDDDFELVGVDPVRDPSFFDARLRENVLRESLHRGLPSRYVNEPDRTDTYQQSPGIREYNHRRQVETITDDDLNEYTVGAEVQAFNRAAGARRLVAGR